MDLQLGGKTALVTGASTPGIGRAIAVFLASPRAGYITGTVIPVDGGMKRFAF